MYEGSETVGSSDSGTGHSGQDFGPDDAQSVTSHSHSLGVTVNAQHPKPKPIPPADPTSRPVSLDTVLAAPHVQPTLKHSDARYDTLRASWPGAVAYAGSFMAARVAQFALTASANPTGAAMAFATVAGLLHLGVEPVVGALREKMGMRSDEDALNYNNYVTSMASYVESWMRGDQAGMEQARRVARAILASCNYDCAHDPGKPADQQKPMPGAWEEATAMLTAGARGIASNELPFFTFSVVYMLTNPAGLWLRTSLLEAFNNKNLATATELLVSVAGGLLSGIGTVGIQNAARATLQATGDSPARSNIKLDRLNWRNLEFTQASLKSLKDALKASLDAPEPQAQTQPDMVGIESAISDALYAAHVAPLDAATQGDVIRIELEKLPQEDRRKLLAEVKVRSRKAKQPYNVSHAIGEKYRQMVATKDVEGIYRADPLKIKRAAIRGVTNVAGLMLYSIALVDTINSIAHYGPANEAHHANSTGAFGADAYPTTTTEAYTDMATLGWTLIGCWVGFRALAPAVELGISTVTGAASGVGNAVSSGWASFARRMEDALASPPITQGPPGESGRSHENGVDIV